MDVEPRGSSFIFPSDFCPQLKLSLIHARVARDKIIAQEGEGREKKKKAKESVGD